MIIAIIGGIGSGKSVTTVKEILNKNRKCFVNFDIKSNNAVRLKVEHIIKDDITLTANGKEIHNQSVNWDFWNKEKDKGSFDIYIDEAHNIFNSRRSQTKFNMLFSLWITQVRKLFGDKEDRDLYLITQRLSALDVVARDLAGKIIYCKKIMPEATKNVYIIKYTFQGTYCTDKFEAFSCGLTEKADNISFFYANPFFKYYNSHQLISFGNQVYL